MDEIIFQECYQGWIANTPNYLKEIAAKYGYSNSEVLRSQFRRARAKRGLSKIGDRVANIDRTLDLPKVGVMDIEALPGIGYFWGMWGQDIYEEQVIEDICLLSWSAKFLDDDTMYSDILTSQEAKNRDPKRITLSAHEFISKCDIMIGHNWKGYDGKMLNTYFLLYASPVVYRTIDTLEVAKSTFKFSRNSLHFINEKLGIRNKVETGGFPLWKRCSNGEQEALDEMLNYNEGDILSTEDLFWRLQPFINNMPNFSLYRHDDDLRGCRCGSYNVKNIGLWHTNTARYDKMQCLDCGAIMRGKKNLLSKDQRMSMLMNIQEGR